MPYRITVYHSGLLFSHITCVIRDIGVREWSSNQKLIFQEILCCWGAIAEIITDNGTPIIAALYWVSKKYHINYIQISVYNKQAMD